MLDVINPSRGGRLMRKIEIFLECQDRDPFHRRGNCSKGRYHMTKSQKGWNGKKIEILMPIVVGSGNEIP